MNFLKRIDRRVELGNTNQKPRVPGSSTRYGQHLSKESLNERAAVAA
jgi:hypothetical protein